MKLIHLSDLHLGKRVNEYSMLDDQEDILNKILAVIDDEQPQAVVIAGDIYDKTVPPAEAVQMFDRFLNRLARRQLQVMIISGNHDSAERVAFGAKLMQSSGIHLSPVYDGTVTSVDLQDAYGTVRFHLIPFLKPANVRRFETRQEISDYTQAMQAVIANADVDPDIRNVAVVHQFVTGAQRSDSEEISVGGLDNVDASVFDCFDYTALGHIHGPQSIGRETIRYCGTPLKYSFSEKDHVKSVTVVELREKGNVKVHTVPLVPLHDMREIRGTYDELTLRAFYEGTRTDDYLHIILTDEEDVPDAVARLRLIYPNLMKLDYDNTRTRNNRKLEILDEKENKSETELFAEFYETQNNQELTQEQHKYVLDVFEKLKEGQR